MSRAASDGVLLGRVGAGSEAALAELYDRHGRLAFGLAFRVLRDRALAEDAVQEAFLAVWRSAGRFRPDRGTGRAWILSLVHRRAVDLVRHENRRRVDDPLPAVAASAEAADEAAWRSDERRRVQDALADLSVSQRRLLELAYYGGLTQSQIAERLDLPLGTVKSRTAAALDRLSRLLGEEADERRPEALEGVAAGA